MKVLGRQARGALTVAMAVAAVALGLLGCPPNEEILCGTKSENTAPSCSAEYTLCAGGTDRLECKPGGGSGVSCACIENGVTRKTFQSDDACNVTPDTLKKRAEVGCSWTLEENQMK